MNTFLTKRAPILVGVLFAGSIIAAACGDDGKESSVPATQAPMATTMPSSSMMGAFGPACSAVPTDGAGSFAGMAADPAATAASNNPVLSTLVTAVKAAGLVDTLNGPGPFTIFAPTNDAFGNVDKATLDSLLADPKGSLTEVLTYHVVAGTALDADALKQGAAQTTVNGAELKVSAMGDTLSVNGQGNVVCGNVKVANGIVHIIDGVLNPMAA